MTDQLDRRVTDAIRAIVEDVPVTTPAPETVRSRAGLGAYRSEVPTRARRRAWLPALAAAAAVLVVLAAAVVVPFGGGAGHLPAAPDGHAVLPRQMPGGNGLFTGLVSDAPPGRAIALHVDRAWDPLSLLRKEVLVHSADGRAIRRVDLAERRGAVEEDGDRGVAEALLSPDGWSVAVTVADRETDRIEVVDLRTGRATAYPLGRPAAVRPLAWTPDSGRLVLETGDAVADDVVADTTVSRSLVIMDLATRSVSRLTGPGGNGGGTWLAAFSPDGRQLVTSTLQYTGDPPTLYVTDLAGGATRVLTGPRDHNLAGVHAWSRDGTTLALTGRAGDGGQIVSFLDLTGRGGPVPGPVRTGFGRDTTEVTLLGWRSPGTMLLGAPVRSDSGFGEQVVEVAVAGGTPPRLLGQGSAGLQLAQDLLPTAEVRDTDPSRGPWPLSAWLCLLVVVGTVVLFVRALRRRARRNREQFGTAP